MGKFKLCFALTILHLFESINGQKSLYNQQSTNVDYFIISQQWPQTSYLELNHLWGKADNTCNVPNYFTLHGVWPTSRASGILSDCKTKEVFKSKSLSSTLKAQLQNKWRNYYTTSQNNYGFLSYQWKKHGSCALGVEATNSLPKYFSAALALLDKYDAGKILDRNAIFPGREYNFFDIYNAIHNTLRVNVYVRCINNPITNKQYLKEVRVCVDTKFRSIDCNDNRHISNCNYRNKVVYPKALKTG